MTTRRVHSTPTFALIESEKELESVVREMQKVKPGVEITIEGMTEIAKGKILEWHPSRHFFSVAWDKKSEAFDDRIESRADLRAFFKAQLFSKQLMFKTVTVRRVNEDLYHFRIPEQMYQQQRRGALRVPILTRNAALISSEGEFEIIDLSVGGAKLRPIGEISKKSLLGRSLLNCSMKLGRLRISNENFGVKITSQDATTVGCRFAGLEQGDQVQIKQFLVEALRRYYKEEL
jgi:hypothetical protein